MKLKIWTEAYNPFIMGGDVNAPIATELEITSEAVELGEGIRVYEVVSPQGRTHIIEEECGAMVGTSLDQVRENFEEAPIGVVRKQIADGLERVKRATVLSNKDFWGKFK